MSSDSLAESVSDADLVVVEMVDTSVAACAEELAGLRAQCDSAGAALAVRLHAAWRSCAPDPGDDEAPELDALWEHADSVLFLSRHHLVRIASGGTIDSAKAMLVPAVIQGIESGGGDEDESPGAAERASSEGPLVLVAGEVHHAALAPVMKGIEALGAGPSEARARDWGTARSAVVMGHLSFRDALRRADVVAVPACGTLGDRLIVDAAARAGVPVVAAKGASEVDAPPPAGVRTITRISSEDAWRDALGSALSGGRVSPREDGQAIFDGLLARQMEALRSILEKRGLDAGNCSSEAAA